MDESTYGPQQEVEKAGPDHAPASRADGSARRRHRPPARRAGAGMTAREITQQEMTPARDTACRRLVDEFNAAHPIGVWVRYAWNGAIMVGRTQSRAFRNSDWTAHIWIGEEKREVGLDDVEVIPDQPDNIKWDSRDTPDPVMAAERVGAYIAANGDGIYNVIDGHPLYARDLESLRRAAPTVAGLRAMVAEQAAEIERLSQVAEAAKAWRAQFSKPPLIGFPREAALIDAVDALAAAEQVPA
ncbi:hypothetical protein [Micromonospora sp. WMMD737]|uniref:hypothetical protein n=1 Tax=Micromonospora sp. WMMD737 TaxID=3404113 RepID=UPI003B946637